MGGDWREIKGYGCDEAYEGGLARMRARTSCGASIENDVEG